MTELSPEQLLEVVRGAGALVQVHCGDGVTTEAGLVTALLLHKHLGGLVPGLGAGDSNTCLVIPDLSLQASVHDGLRGPSAKRQEEAQLV